MKQAKVPVPPTTSNEARQETDSNIRHQADLKLRKLIAKTISTSENKAMTAAMLKPLKAKIIPEIPSDLDMQQALDFVSA